MTILRGTIALGAGLLLVTAACGSDGDDSSGADVSLPGTSWRLVQVDGEEAVAGSGASLELGVDGSAGGATGCNSFNGAYEVDGRDLSFGPLASTQAACADPALTAQEAAYLQALGTTSQFAVDGDKMSLEDSDGGALAELTRFTSELAGTSWDVISVNNGNEAVVSVLGGTELSLGFDDEGMVTGAAGCNDFFGPYEVTGDEISFGPLGATRKTCPDPEGVMVQEGQYLAALDRAATFQFAGERLELRAANGELAVSLSPAG